VHLAEAIALEAHHGCVVFGFTSHCTGLDDLKSAVVLHLARHQLDTSVRRRGRLVIVGPVLA
jgi:hypothetical protein